MIGVRGAKASPAHEIATAQTWRHNRLRSMSGRRCHWNNCAHLQQNHEICHLAAHAAGCRGRHCCSNDASRELYCKQYILPCSTSSRELKRQRGRRCRWSGCARPPPMRHPSAGTWKRPRRCMRATRSCRRCWHGSRPTFSPGWVVYTRYAGFLNAIDMTFHTMLLHARCEYHLPVYLSRPCQNPA